jgi:methylmalonyl-CoA/ethylmalonyl-CoA epimerase
MLELIDHIGIVTPDLDTGSAPYLRLGLTPLGADEENPIFASKLRVFQIGESLIELVAPTSPDSPLTQYLEARGPGLHHIAFRVDDIVMASRELLERGATFLTPEPLPGRAGSRVMFLDPSWGAGTLIELVEHKHTKESE